MEVTGAFEYQDIELEYVAEVSHTEERDPYMTGDSWYVVNQLRDDNHIISIMHNGEDITAIVDDYVKTKALDIAEEKYLEDL